MSTAVTVAATIAAYRSGQLTPAQHLKAKLAAARADSTNSWIALISDSQLESYLAALADHSAESLPLYGVPFAIKDNVDLAGLPTTAGCKDYAYQPESTAFAVEKLIQAGAVPLGKTNLDQFATGLVGTRSPWGATHNSFNPEYISGGSSAGSAVTVATGQVCFSLGTDTAGSGRVPAAFNNILGLKASKGRISCSGVVPACKSLDCLTLFAHTAEDLSLLLAVAGEYDVNDCYARPAMPAPTALSSLAGAKIGVPQAKQLAFFGNHSNEQLFGKALQSLKVLGAELVEIDFQPFLDAAKLLYEGPWVAERYAAIQEFFEQDASRCLPVIQTIIGGAQGKTAVDAFNAAYKLQQYKVICDQLLSQVDVMVTPTAGSIYTIDAVNADPITLNSENGYYTNFMNLLDYAAVAVPAGFNDSKLPFGITLFGPAGCDDALLKLAGQWQQSQQLPLGATGEALPAAAAIADGAALVEVAVCGAHLQGLPLNSQLLERGAKLKQATTTSANYRLFALAGGPPFRPGLIRDETAGRAIEVEVWQLPVASLGSFLAGIPQPLGLGKLELESGAWVTGFICEGYAIADAREITEFGGWRGYLASQ
ncbi:allophanate hydrolase [Reinekea marinisedimentorum]|uniref:Allophanate hydrolase n=1 Tax=Reinekea marinisedimentorum TaxID=230495 RepID=A0A4V6NY32_9GAMM|nr:allophanate hydrolase [Reinekea marinisedimentorum]TCS41026.1 allophanate hydrolase [Reinekea marinisedimentorum]